MRPGLFCLSQSLSVFLLHLNIGFAASAMSESRKNDRFPGLSAAELEERASNGEKFKNLVGGNRILISPI
jgi:hypothetical protein